MLKKVLLVHGFLEAIAKMKHTLGLRRRERIEVQATLKTIKKRKKTGCKQTPTHTLDFNEKVPKSLSK